MKESWEFVDDAILYYFPIFYFVEVTFHTDK